MKVTIKPSKLAGEVLVPSSKSILHRGLICAALAPGKSVIHRLYLSRDIQATMDCLTALGASFTCQGEDVTVEGIQTPVKEATLSCGESGSTLRFLIPVAAALSVNASFAGQGRLVTRPLTAYDSAFQGKGVAWHNTGALPCAVSGQLKPGNYEIDGSQSSQFISGLLFALPLLSGDSTLTVTGKFQSQSYVGITLGALKDFGIAVHQTAPNKFSIPGRQVYQAGEFTAESDYSQSAFFLCAAALGADLKLRSFSQNSLQGDKAILSILEQAGFPVRFQGDTISLSAGKLKPFTIYAGDIPDLVPVLCVLASGCVGESRIYQVERLKIKESDRIASTMALINGLGGKMEYLPQEDCIRILGKGFLDGGVVPCENDHRIAMSGGVAALLCRNPVTLLGAECVAKSYPTFWEDYQRLGGTIHVQSME